MGLRAMDRWPMSLCDSLQRAFSWFIGTWISSSEIQKRSGKEWPAFLPGRSGRHSTTRRRRSGRPHGVRQQRKSPLQFPAAHGGRARGERGRPGQNGFDDLRERKILRAAGRSGRPRFPAPGRPAAIPARCAPPGGGRLAGNVPGPPDFPACRSAPGHRPCVKRLRLNPISVLGCCRWHQSAPGAGS